VSAENAVTGRVVFVGAGPGDPDLITVRGLRELQRAQVILYDNLIDERILEGLAAEQIYVGKEGDRHSLPQVELSQRLVELAKQGKRVVRLKGGDPSVFGRLAQEALVVAEQGIPFEIVPGVTSCVAGPAYAGIPVTHRGVADHFSVVTAHQSSDTTAFSIPPYNKKNTVVLMMSLASVEAWRAQMLEMKYPAELPVALITRAASATQRVLVTCLDEVARAVAEASLESPTLAVVGHVVALREKLDWFDPALMASVDPEATSE
jgi:uroporphyrinogen III methyltransferase/synthase